MFNFSERMRGVHLDHRKRSRMNQTVFMPSPATVEISLSQHIGAPCEPLVAVGDSVFVGQKIADSSAFISAPIHSSVSGRVSGITERLGANGRMTRAIVIESDGLDTPDPSIAPPKVNDQASFLEAVRNSGLVGLGGAGFPTHVKLAAKNINTLYINLAECEPYITTDNREVFEFATDIIDGIRTVLKYTGIPKAVIVIERNKPIAAQILSELCADIETVSIKVIGSRYPKGAEKVLVYEAGGPLIGRGKLPADLGVIILNVSTVSYIAKYLRTGMPLVRRRLTVDGDKIKNPGNFSVAVGTSAGALLDFAGIDSSQINMLLAGGVMMGSCLIDLDTPILKNTNALICL